MSYLTTSVINRIKAANTTMGMKENITPALVNKKLKFLGINFSLKEIEAILRILSRNEMIRFNLFYYGVPRFSH